MTENDILDAIGDIDPAYLEEAESKSSADKFKWIGFGALAACFFMFLIFPLGYYHYLWGANNGDYAPKDYNECVVYYVRDGEILYEATGVWGGDTEMFAAWMEKNDININVDLSAIGFSFAPSDGAEDGSGGYLVTVTVPSAISAYFEKDNGALLLEALKKTIASYRHITVGGLELIYL